MPKIEKKPIDKNCPECSGGLEAVTETWDPFPDDDGTIYRVVSERCPGCGYELVTLDELANIKTPYVVRGALKNQLSPAQAS